MSIGLKKTVTAVAVVVVVVSVLSVWLLYPRGTQTVSFNDDFEEGLDNWSMGADVPEDPDKPGQPIEWRIECSATQSVSGSHSVRFAIDGSQDDGTIWIQHKLSLQSNVEKTVSVSFQLWSPSQSFNTIAVVVGYAGKSEPDAEESFQVIGAANQAAGWKKYNFTATVKAENGTAYIALGISVRWETTMEYFIDDVDATAT